MFRPVFLAWRVLELERRQHGLKVCSLHTPEVEGVSKGKAHPRSGSREEGRKGRQLIS